MGSWGGGRGGGVERGIGDGREAGPCVIGPVI